MLGFGSDQKEIDNIASKLTTWGPGLYDEYMELETDELVKEVRATIPANLIDIGETYVSFRVPQLKFFVFSILEGAGNGIRSRSFKVEGIQDYTGFLYRPFENLGEFWACCADDSEQYGRATKKAQRLAKHMEKEFGVKNISGQIGPVGDSQ